MADQCIEFLKNCKECGYLKNVIEPIDSRDAKILLVKKYYIFAPEAKVDNGSNDENIKLCAPRCIYWKGDAVIFSSKIIPGNEKKFINYIISL